MLEVLSPEQTRNLIIDTFSSVRTNVESTPVSKALGRTLARDVLGCAYLPPFTRSTVDGYALHSSDTFGATNALPALLECVGTIPMGKSAPDSLQHGSCLKISTGGALPSDSDAVIMVEHTENYGGNTLGVLTSVAPGENLLFKGDEVKPGSVVISAGTTLSPHHRGALDALGMKEVEVYAQPKVGIISTGDELVAPSEDPKPGEIRDVNSGLLHDCVVHSGAIPQCYGIIEDEVEALKPVLEKATTECDLVLISGGTSVGERDTVFEVLNACGAVLSHGIAMKPGKPTLVAHVAGTPVFGLPGHPVAAYFIYLLFIQELVGSLQGAHCEGFSVKATLGEAVSANHGRAEFLPVKLLRGNNEDLPEAQPIRIKSGLIALLATSDGFIEVPRNSEGLPKGTEVAVRLLT